MRHIIDAFKQYQIYGAVVMFWANTIGFYGFTATVPSVIQDLGYSSANAQLLTIPIYIAAMIVVLVFAFWSEKVQQRTPFIMAGYSIAVLGFIAQLAIPQTRLPGLTYGFLFPVAIGLYSPFIQIVCLTANNLAPSSKRAVGMAILISIGNFGGIAGSNVSKKISLLSNQFSTQSDRWQIYIKSQAPKYPVGFGTGLAICCCAIIMAFLLRLEFARQNRKKRELLDREGEDAIRARYTDQELLDLGDKSPFFFYTL